MNDGETDGQTIEGNLISVAVGRPVPEPFTYRVPPELGCIPEPGRRLVVPFGRATAVGFSLGPASGPAPKGLRDIRQILDDAPLFDAPLLRLLLWAAGYYRFPPGEVLRAALPPGLTGCLTPSGAPPRHAIQTWLALTDAGRNAQVRGPRMKAVLEYLNARSEPEVPLDELLAAMPSCRPAVARLEEQGFCRVWTAARAREPADASLTGKAPLSPTPEQAQALTAIRQAIDERKFAPFLLHGVTGSGKTEVYLRAIERCLDLGLGALVLVPEISLTPQLVGRFRARFGEKVALLHSGLKDSERLSEWRRLKNGEAPLAVGVRSAIFAPVRSPGLIVVDEEHDGSFKQEDGFRYSARDLAVVRAQQQGCPVLLGSATPSLETLWNAQSGRYRTLRLSRRIDDRPMPTVRLVDLKQTKGHLAAAFPQLAGKMRLMAAESARMSQEGAEAPEETAIYDADFRRGSFQRAASSLSSFQRPRRTDDRPLADAPLISPELADAIQRTLDRGRQTILFLNRRGTTTFHLCLDCGQPLRCPDCAVSLTLHHPRGELLCHYCGRNIPLPSRCPTCGGRIERLGMGTEQAEQELSKLFPSARIDRLDRDSAGRPEDLTRRLSSFARGEKDILIGTQMVAKGHDFPGVLLVGVLLADLALNLPDFRAAERTFQLVTQVAGRAGRGTEPGEVIVQTFDPSAPAVARVVGHDFDAFAEGELQLRRRACFPPFCRLISCRIEGPDGARTEAAARQTASAAAAAIRASGQPIRLLGPAPAPLSRLKGQERWQFLLKGPTAKSLVPVASAVERAAASLKGGVRVSLDVDPLSML